MTARFRHVPAEIAWSRVEKAPGRRSSGFGLGRPKILAGTVCRPLVGRTGHPRTVSSVARSVAHFPQLAPAPRESEKASARTEIRLSRLGSAD